jgi:hypothetical protein
MFEATYQALSDEHPQWGHVAILPWDQVIFGFPVADYRAGDSRYIANTRTSFRERFNQWAAVNRVELVGCAVAAEDILWCRMLQELDFVYVDYNLKVSRSRLQSQKLPPSKIPVRLAQMEDQASVERIAQHAFRAGRYHMDPRFPRSLSELRYKHWLGNAFAALGPGSRLYVTGELGQATSFLHVNLMGDEAYVTIIAVAPENQGGRIGLDLCAGVVRDLQTLGIKRMSSKLSPMNLNIMNFMVYFGWRFSDPQSVFHWHAPDAPHLVPSEEIQS